MFNAWNDRKKSLYTYVRYIPSDIPWTQHAKIAKILKLVKMIGRKIFIIEEK
jgi:hypothetical protein